VLAGLDVGTTSVKAFLMTADGQELSRGRAATGWNPAGTEVDALQLVAAARSALRQALDASPGLRVVGLGVASMAESGVLLGASGEPLAPVIAWHDARDAAELARLQVDLGGQNFSRRTGLPIWTQWSLTKHRWQLAHVPAARAAVRRLNVAEWIVRSFGGDEASEQSLASRTGWLDLASRSWWADALEWSGARPTLLPDLVVAGTRLGTMADIGGLPELANAALTVAGHDHQSAAVGVRAAEPGDELDSCGTAEALVRTIPAGLDPDTVTDLAAAGVTVGWHVVADHWCLLGGTQGGLVLQRLLEALGTDLPSLDALAQSPVGRPARLEFGGPDVVRILDHGSGPGAVWQAGVEAVTAQATAVNSVITAAAGPHRNLVVTGGWSHSAALMEAKAVAMGALTLSKVEEAGARGAALFAGISSGVYANVAEFPAAPAAATTPRYARASTAQPGSRTP
jgi:sugar (pentulose or hexulose) kinase